MGRGHVGFLLALTLVPSLGSVTQTCRHTAVVEGKFTCDPGEEAIEIRLGLLTCSQCQHHQFQPCRNQVGDSCIDKNTCDSPGMYLLNYGDKKTDSKCACDKGYYLQTNSKWCLKDENTNVPDILPALDGEKSNEGGGKWLKRNWYFVLIAFLIVLLSLLSAKKCKSYRQKKRKKTGPPCSNFRSKRSNKKDSLTQKNETIQDDSKKDGIQKPDYLKIEIDWRGQHMETDAVPGGCNMLSASSGMNGHPVIPPPGPNNNIHPQEPAPGQNQVHHNPAILPELPGANQAPGPAVNPPAILAVAMQAPGIIAPVVPAPPLVPNGGAAGAQPQVIQVANSENIEGSESEPVSNVIQTQQETSL